MNGTKIALVTGGSRGIGRAEALVLAAEGIDVVLTYRTGKAEAEEVVEQVTAQGRKAVALRLDTSVLAEFDGFAADLRETLHSTWERTSFDILINNAGFAVGAPFAATTEQQFDDMLGVHLKGVFFLTQALLPLIADGGSIVNCSSGTTRFVVPGAAAYASMKGAVEVLTRYQAQELGARGIRVNVIAPGPVDTAFGGGVNDAIRAMVAEQTALGSIGKPEDIAGAVTALVSDASRWINAQRIEVTGGTHL